VKRTTLIAIFGMLVAAVAMAATPNSGTLTPLSRVLDWTGGGPYVVPAPTNSVDTCAVPLQCDIFTLTADFPADYATTNCHDSIHIQIGWVDPDGNADFDFFVYDAAGNLISGSSAAGSSNPEVFDIPAFSGTKIFTIRVKPFLPLGLNYTGSISLVSGAGGDCSGPAPQPDPPPAPSGLVPRYYSYAAPKAVGENAGEPSIGYNLISHKAMFIAGLQTLLVTFPQDIMPAGSVPEAGDAIWKDVSNVVTKTKSLDPILFTDQKTGRTWVSQLNSIVPPASPVLIGLNSLMAYTDDDGANWIPAQVNPPDGSYDHQTVGAGPYPAPVPEGINPVYQNAVYYCAQAGLTAICARSDDGGLNFGPGVPIYNSVVDGVNGTTCGALHGHVKVAPDGTVYVPSYHCPSGADGTQGMAVSIDAGTTWTVANVPNSTPPPGASILDPSIGVAKDGTVYFCYVNGLGRPHVAVSKDRGATWTNDADIGASLGIENAVFVEAVAGDSDRAACGFVGTRTAGNHEDANFKGTWYVLIAHTYDGGAHWTTVNATPNAPVQREACIWNEGGSNPCRNLLDFNEITADEKGRVLYSYADGCINDCESGGPNSYSAKATIARQSGGKGLIAAFDPAEPTVPQRPFLSGRRDDMASYLKWRAPDYGGSDITRYEIYRGTSSGNEVFIGQTTAGKFSFNDRAISASVAQYTYKVRAVNAVGAGGFSNIIELTVGPRLEPTGACTLPGVEVISDPTGDESDTLPQHDITSVSVAEPDSFAGKIVFTIKVANLATIPPGGRWAVRFSAPQKPPDTALYTAEDWFVSMVTSDGPAPTFTYGSTGVAQGAARVFTTIGSCDPASSVTSDGVITLILPKAVIGNPQPGQDITGMLGSVRATVPSTLPGTGGTNETIPDSTGAGSYRLRPANLCLPNTAPLAAISANPSEGFKPLLVHFDASASSDADSIDTIASYTFNFGDGTDDVTQSSPRIDYTLAKPGIYAVKLVVTDSRGKLSSNTAQQIIVVHNVPTITSLTPSSVCQGGPAFTVAIDGSAFLPGAKAEVNGVARPATVVSPTRMTVKFAANEANSPGTISIRVLNPDGGISNAATLTVLSNSASQCPH
jgi:PKD repeat protein